jgi:pilus assembly protein Flp/PilA
MPVAEGEAAMRGFLRIFKDERGATAVEYGLILALVFLAMITGVSTFGQTTINMWTYVANEVGGR